MDVIEAIRNRRSIRRYTDTQVPRDVLDAVIEAGRYAPNAGGGQRTFVCGIQDRTLCEQLGVLNAARMDRTRLAGSFVSDEQPSLIDDPTLTSGFYGAPTVCVVFAPQNFLYGIPDAFCFAQTMALAAYGLGVASCIVARAEETFDNEFGRQLMTRWGVPDGYVARCFLLLGYIDGPWPAPKPRKEGRSIIVE